MKAKKLEMYESDFWNEKKKFSRKFYVRNGKLWCHRAEGNESEMRPVGKHEFQMVSSNSPIMKFDFSNPDAPTMIVWYGKSNAGYFKAFNPIEPTPLILK